MESLLITLKLHSPEELVLLSNIAHWIEGGIFLIVASIALIQVFGYWKNKLYLWPSFMLGAGLFLPIFIFIHHFNDLGLAWQVIIYDPQQRQHMLIGILMIVAGVSELIYLKSQKLGWRFVLPIVLTIIGVLFLTHPQHGTSEAVMQAAMIHQYLGTAFVLAGIFRGAEVIWTGLKWLTFPWTIFLIIISVLLISYREPDGAYQTKHSDLENLHNIHSQ